jgi:4-amino-4-deoxy-L-arabinose transferase-like glycosyltransferase
MNTGLFEKAKNPQKNLCLSVFIRVPFILTLLAFWLRTYRLDHQSYWIDEAWTVYFANLTLGELWHLLQTVEIMPPLYHPSTIYWVKLVGDSEYALRFYSVVCGVMAVPFTYRLGKDLGGERLGLLTAFLMTISPYQIWHSQDARMYSMLTASSAMSMWGFVALWRRGGWRWWLVYVVGTEWAIMTHYHGAVNIGIQGLFLLLTWRRHWRGYLAWGGTLLLMLLLYLPWLIFGGNLLQSYLNWIPQPTLWDSYVRSAIAYSVGELVPRAEAIPLTLAFVAMYVLGLMHAARPVAWGSNPRLSRSSTLKRTPSLSRLPADLRPITWGSNPRLSRSSALKRTPSLSRLPADLSLLACDLSRRPLLAFLLAYTLAPNLAAWLYGELRTTVYFERYLILVQIGYLLTVAVGLLGVGGLSWSWRKNSFSNSLLQLPPLLLLAGINAWVLYHHYSDPVYAKPDWRAVARKIEHFGLPGDAIILTGDGGEKAFHYYYRGDAPVLYPFNTPVPTEDEAKHILAQIAATHRRLWYTPYGVAIDATLEAWLAQHAYPGWHSWLGRKRLALYHTGPITPTRREALSHSFAGSLTLTEAILPAKPVAAGDLLPMDLAWEGPLGPNVQLSLRLLNERGDNFAQSDWPPLAAAADKRSLWIPPDTPPGRYALEFVLYDPASGEPFGRPALIPGVEVAPAQLIVPPEALPIPNPTRHPLGPLTLVGYALPEKIAPGRELWLWLYWQANEPLAPDTRLTLTLGGDGEALTADFLLADSAGWRPGQIRRAIYHLPTSPRLAGDTATVRVRLAGQDVQIAPIELLSRPRQFTPPPIPQPLEATFGDLPWLKLLGYSLQTPTQTPNSFSLTLYWRAEAEMDTDYTVFIQLLDAAGQLVAQVDGGGRAPPPPPPAPPPPAPPPPPPPPHRPHHHLAARRNRDRPAHPCPSCRPPPRRLPPDRRPLRPGHRRAAAGRLRGGFCHPSANYGEIT